MKRARPGDEKDDVPFCGGSGAPLMVPDGKGGYVRAPDEQQFSHQAKQPRLSTGPSVFSGSRAAAQPAVEKSAASSFVGRFQSAR